MFLLTMEKTFTLIGYIICHKLNHSKFKELESMYSNHRVEANITNKNIREKISLNSSKVMLNDPWIQRRIPREFEKKKLNGLKMNI